MRLRPPVPPALLTNRARRAAAALCLALALLTSLSPSSHSSPARVVVPPGLVTTTAAVFADAVSFVHDGDRIDLVAPIDGVTDGASARPVVVARGVQVLRVQVSGGAGGAGGTPRAAQLLVAAPSDVAAEIAAHQGGQVLAAISAPP